MDRRKHIRRGFSLVEAAIVLGVVGLVIGGIWVAAANMHESYKVNKTVADLSLIVKNVQGLISERDALAIGNVVEITSMLIASNTFPKDWVNGNSIKSPFGGMVTSFNYSGAPNPSFFSIRFFSLPKHICIKLVVEVSSMAANTDGKSFNRPSLGEIQVNYPTWYTGTFPVDTAQAETFCTSATNNSVYLYYGYTRIN